MKPQKSALFQPTFVFPMVSVCVLVGAFLVYYFPVTAQQEASLNRRAFRSLAAVSDGVSARVVSYVDVLAQAAKRGAGGPPSPGAQFSVTVRGKPNDCVPSRPGDVKVSTAVVDGSHHLELICGSWKGTLAIDGVLQPYLRDGPRQLFDDVLLTDAEGAVLNQSIATGGRISSIRSVLATPAAEADPKPAPAGSAPTPFATASQSSTLVSAMIAGEEYKLYLVPVPLNIEGTNAASSRLALAGLMRVKRFRAESMALPGSALVSAILLVLVVMAAAWPLLKFATMGATDRIPRRSAAYLFLLTLATIILVCILALHLRYVVYVGDVDAGLRQLADGIEKNVESELTLALRVMDSANNSQMLAEQLQPPGGSGCTALSSAERIAVLHRNLLAQRGVRLSDYPYFDRIIWTDNRGIQHVKWEAGAPTSATDVSDRSYFIDTVANRLWQFDGASPASSRFRVDWVVTRNTGESRAVISQKAPAWSICKDVELSVVSMITPLLSLIDPIVPPEYGFAVVDPTGLVQFHSVSARNGQERFLDEVEDAAELGTALFARQGKLLTARYLGADHRLFVTPLARLRQSPWSLIVFYDLSARAAQHLERIVLFSVLAFACFAVLAVVLLVAPATRGPRAWMWPRRDDRGSYIHLTATVILIAPPIYLLTFALSAPTAVFALACLVPALLLGMAILKLRTTRHSVGVIALGALLSAFVTLWVLEPRSKVFVGMLLLSIVAALVLLSMRNVTAWYARLTWPGLTGSYVAVWATLVTAVALLPCIGFFRIAYDYHSNLSTRRQQVQTMAALAEREERVKAQYGSRVLTAPDGRSSPDVAHWLFIRRRLEQTLDRYDALLLSPDSGQLFDGRTVSTDPAVCEDGLLRYVRALASLQPFGRAALTRTLIETDAERPSWHWCREGVNRLRLRGPAPAAAVDEDALSLPPTRALFNSVTRNPAFLHPELVSELPVLEAWWLPLPLMAFAAAACIAFVWLKPTLAQMFLLEVTPIAPLPEIVLDDRTSLSGRLILLATDRAHVSQALRANDNVHVIDVGEFVRGAVAFDDSITRDVAALDHFDYRNDDEQANRKKLEMLERLAARRPGTSVVIVAAVDPAYFFSAVAGLGIRPSLEGLVAGEEMERWATALAPFTRLRVTHMPSQSAVERSRMVWSTCTTAERVALYQLAHDGWVNPRNEAALQHLQARGLISGPPFKFTDPALRAFVSQSIGARDRKAWERQDQATAWDGIRLMFAVVLLGVVAATLFFSQQSVLGLVATGLGILTGLTKLLSEANSFKSLLGFGKAEK